jgi:myo-inositol 2-dehydrogenase/D-chiro-inositol 1-dehydrogenase
MEIDRRFFLLGSAVAAHAFQTEKPVNTAMIGTGNRGSFLLQGVLKQPNAKVLALCDIKPDRLDKAATAAAKDNPATYADWRRIIERKDVDAVFIATPPYLHSEMAIEAIKAGKHVYCEKPLGVTAAQVRALLDAAKGSTKVFVAGQQLRSQKQLAETVRKIRDGVIGDVVMVKAQRHAPADLDHDGTSGDWYFDVTKSGGYLIEQSVHNLDLCNWAIGAHPLRACGFGGIVFYKNDPPGRTIFDCGSITYELSQRGEDVLHAERISPRVHASRQSVRVRIRHQGRRGPDHRQHVSAGERQSAGSFGARPAGRPVRAHCGILRFHRPGHATAGGHQGRGHRRTHGHSGP